MSYYVVFRCWPIWGDDFPYERLTGIPDDQIDDALEKFAREWCLEQGKRAVKYWYKNPSERPDWPDYSKQFSGERKLLARMATRKGHFFHRIAKYAGWTIMPWYARNYPRYTLIRLEDQTKAEQLVNSLDESIEHLSYVYDDKLRPRFAILNSTDLTVAACALMDRQIESLKGHCDYVENSEEPHLASTEALKMTNFILAAMERETPNSSISDEQSESGSLKDGQKTTPSGDGKSTSINLNFWAVASFCDEDKSGWCLFQKINDQWRQRKSLHIPSGPQSWMADLFIEKRGLLQSSDAREIYWLQHKIPKKSSGGAISAAMNKLRRAIKTAVTEASGQAEVGDPLPYDNTSKCWQSNVTWGIAIKDPESNRWDFSPATPSH